MKDMKEKNDGQQKEQALFQVGQKLLLYRPADQKFLFVKSANTEGAFYKNYGPWDLVGGRMDLDENIDEALKREIEEEVGDIEYELDQPLQPLGRVEMQYTRSKVIQLGFLAIYLGGEVTLSEEHSEAYWATAEEALRDELFKPWLKQWVTTAVERLEEKEYLADLKRVQADFENYKKRELDSKKDLKGLLIEKLVLDIVPVLDNFRQATLHVPSEQQDSPWVVGIQYIEKQLETVLIDNGITMIEAAAGEAFNPAIHEAIDAERQNQESGIRNQEKQQKITKVIQKGYKFGDRVIRPAKVIVK